MIYISPLEIIPNEKVAYWINFQANTKLGFYRFMDAFNEAVAYVDGVDVDLLDDEVLNILENKSEYFKDLKHYLYEYSLCILNDIRNIKKRNLKILDYIEVSNIIRTYKTPTGNEYKYDNKIGGHNVIFKGFESILNT